MLVIEDSVATSGSAVGRRDVSQDDKRGRAWHDNPGSGSTGTHRQRPESPQSSSHSSRRPELAYGVGLVESTAVARAHGGPLGRRLLDPAGLRQAPGQVLVRGLSCRLAVPRRRVLTRAAAGYQEELPVAGALCWSAVAAARGVRRRPRAGPRAAVSTAESGLAACAGGWPTEWGRWGETARPARPGDPVVAPSWAFLVLAVLPRRRSHLRELISPHSSGSSRARSERRRRDQSRRRRHGDRARALRCANCFSPSWPYAGLLC